MKEKNQDSRSGIRFFPHNLYSRNASYHKIAVRIQTEFVHFMQSRPHNKLQNHTMVISWKKRIYALFYDTQIILAIIVIVKNEKEGEKKKKKKKKKKKTVL